MDILRAGIGVGALLAGVGVFYNYVVVIPQEHEEAKQAATRAEQKHETEQTAIAAAQERARLAVRAQLDQCLSAAEFDYTANWNKACGKAGSNCKLPRANAEAIDQYRRNEKEDCFKRYPVGGP